MISTKKQFHPLGENQRQPSPSLTNQTLCVYEHFKLQTVLYQRTFNRSHWATCYCTYHYTPEKPKRSKISNNLC
ncbi:hypothetical protein AZO1586I_490 [Bathymodiolus thermophilus thioautotrophic gill symbiont]|uniref:Uncharacterized protein n=2 Tax=sulfur-oxidizing symbionts TaxID=32036 RepID=A0ACA8ZRZ8_9GAMM|nr:hypothetical protein AZO1586I_490 [Bathymodiolus thermophilus thioautotrophic gill symbiont]CAB5505021.1 hypothetical protein AZO1586R_1853 [Bathymodiolus azoricus thioautotrophic gill symbiont]CAC5816772.1 hypothetical protein [uncultured Gammaproteobacteria bacterium]CAC9501676.1 hypothetical protein [uncultured Gammaproteobacteria bacterium]CAC9505826.1 hypothetical protein [uncultured Gammaproteobacteria bacterium]